jgi:hypothetical protein
MEDFKATPHRCQTEPTADEVVDGGGSIDDRGVRSVRGLSCALARGYFWWGSAFHLLNSPVPLDIATSLLDSTAFSVRAIPHETTNLAGQSVALHVAERVELSINKLIWSCTNLSLTAASAATSNQS